MKAPLNDVVIFLNENVEWWEAAARLFERMAVNPTEVAGCDKVWRLQAAVYRERASLSQLLSDNLKE